MCLTKLPSGTRPLRHCSHLNFLSQLSIAACLTTLLFFAKPLLHCTYLKIISSWMVCPVIKQIHFLCEVFDTLLISEFCPISVNCFVPYQIPFSRRAIPTLLTIHIFSHGLSLQCAWRVSYHSAHVATSSRSMDEHLSQVCFIVNFSSHCSHLNFLFALLHGLANSFFSQIRCAVLTLVLSLISMDYRVP